jgi:hypothetical protein
MANCSTIEMCYITTTSSQWFREWGGPGIDILTIK